MKHAIQGRVFLALILLVNISLATAGCEGSPAQAAEAKSNRRQRSPSVPDQDFEVLVEGNTAFALALYQALRESEQNLFFSPYSISSAMAMTYAGARGKTQDEMAHAMHFLLDQEQLHPAFNALDQDLAARRQDSSMRIVARLKRFLEGSEDTRCQIDIANAIWGQKGVDFQSSFLDVLAEDYGAGLRLLDFENDPGEARRVINAWVREQTNDKIQGLIPEGALNPLMRLVLTNAIYFKAEWEFDFEKGSTRESKFFLIDGTRIETPMMFQVEEFDYAEGAGYQAVRLPYVGLEVEMVVLLPAAGQLEAFESRLDAQKLASILAASHPTTVDLALPKFSIESGVDLADALITMGMPSAFGYGADFSGMADDDLLISDVVHKAFVNVDESGTEAAAVTGAFTILGALPQPERAVMYVDRPFLFAIRDVPTGTLLFLGRVLDPRS